MIDGMMIISEDAMDDMFREMPEQLNHGLMSPCNIRTSLYGLFLVAHDTLDHPIINRAMEVLDSIQDCTLFGTLAIFYPPNDISVEGIVRLAKAVVIVATVSHGMKAEDIVEGTGVTMERAVAKSLGVALYIEKVDPMLANLPLELQQMLAEIKTPVLPST